MNANKPARIWMRRAILSLVVITAAVVLAPRQSASSADDEKTVAALDTEYQAAVKINDVKTMDRILADNYVLVNGRGQTESKADLIRESSSGSYVYEHQEDTDRTVRVWGDTAVVTALIWVKGTEDGKPFDHKVWFSDVYVRTPQGWRYVFAQVSRPL